jgi:pilus assembly protein FimV
LNRNSTISGRFALTGVAAAALLLAAQGAWALGLGRLQVQSSLGETLRAEIDVTSLSPEEAANLQVKVASPDAYKAAGVDYNVVLPATRVTLERRADGRPYLRLTSDRGVQEPFVDVILEITWSTGRLTREYTMLFDPPATARAPAPSTAPAMAAASPAAEPARPAAQPRPARVPSAEPAAPSARSTEPRAAATQRAAAAPATKAGPESGDEYRVRQGDTLSKIAGRTQRSGVSLDQMLVALYRANPQAFMDNNMNRLKSGVVLAVPSAESANSTSASEARQVIQAQSADFGAYRQRLAGAVPAAKTEGSTRQASGKVQAQVEDRKQGAAPTPDKLTLSKGTPGAKSPEAVISKETEKKASDVRVAELAKNVDELKKLSGAASAAKPGAAAAPSAAPAPAPAVAITKPTPAPAPAPAAPAPAPAPAPVAKPAPVPAPAPAPAPVVAAAPASAPTPAAPPAPAPAVAASMPALPASVPAVTVAAAPASAPVAAAPTPPAPASAPLKAAAKPPVKPVVPVEEPSFFDSLLNDNPLLLGLGGLAVALLGIFGVYRFAKNAKKDSGETSFLESRLQPDSFFGASGGQRIDTRDAGGNSSSMSYSLSQLDAIGDVDPVAEADVYLAYGRDLQAEEILKEAMRSNPDRMAIRTKLLEVYAKRRDTKGFELLATQLYTLTRGEGEDWAKAQELGAQIDPDNPLFKPGGAPIVRHTETGELVEPLGASTMPQSVLPSPSQYGAASLSGVPPVPPDSGDMGLDLDLDLGGPSTAPGALDSTQTLAPNVKRPDNDMTELDFSPSRAPAPRQPDAHEFDLSDISLDLDLPTEAPLTKPAASAPAPLGRESGLGAIDLPPLDDDHEDPLSRKLELAEEFRQIGDTDGARDLLQEVVAKASGTVKTRAQSMLADLG